MRMVMGLVLVVMYPEMPSMMLSPMNPPTSPPSSTATCQNATSGTAIIIRITIHHHHLISRRLGIHCIRLGLEGGVKSIILVLLLERLIGEVIPCIKVVGSWTCIPLLHFDSGPSESVLLSVGAIEVILLSVGAIEPHLLGVNIILLVLRYTSTHNIDNKQLEGCNDVNQRRFYIGLQLVWNQGLLFWIQDLQQFKGMSGRLIALCMVLFVALSLNSQREALHDTLSTLPKADNSSLLQENTILTQTEAVPAATLPPQTQPTLPPHPPQSNTHANTPQPQSDPHPSQTQNHPQQQQEQPSQSLDEQESKNKWSGLSQQFLQLLNPGGDENLNNTLINKLMQKLGITDVKQLKEQYGVTTKEQQMKQERENAMKNILSSWVNEEREESGLMMNSQMEGNEREPVDTFAFVLKPEQEKKFKMAVSKSRPENFSISIKIYYNVEDNFIPPSYPSQSSFLKMSISQYNRTILERNIYIHRYFEWKQYHQDGAVELTFKNNVKYSILVMADIEELPLTPKDFPKQDKLDPTVEKLKKIVNDIERNHTGNVFNSKASIGLKDQGQKQMGVYWLMVMAESICILVTCYVQVYYLRKLIGNQVIMV